MGSRHRESASPPDDWKPGEKELRIQEVATQKRMSWVQLVVAGTAFLASLAAVGAVLVAWGGVNVAQKGIQRQADENRLATAVTAIGEKNAAERVGGVTLLRRHVEERLVAAASTAPNSPDRWDAYGLYTSALVILANYLRGVPFTTAKEPCPSPMPLDDQYAADALKQLLDMKAAVLALKVGSAPTVDLSSVELCSQHWTDIKFDWLAAAYLLKINLRGSNLEDSHWGHAFLVGAQLQCANLSGADLSHTNMTAADLRGANLYRTKLPKNIKRARQAGVIHVPTSKWNPGPCLSNPDYQN
jgi:Pentapeptide repeats (8 copies)